jgi:predicted ATP-dependent serine protease
VTVLAGDPSAGKSFFAISTAIAACNAGWEVFYLSCEMHEDLVFSRAVRALAGSDLDEWEWRNPQLKTEAILRARTLKIPENLMVVNVDVGVTIEAVVALLAQAVTEKHSLVILDSMSSFVDNLADDVGSRDPFKMDGLRKIVRLATATRRLTHGHVCWLLLSELNKEGKAKGRFIEHRSDIGLAMKSNEDQSHLKTISVTKSWWGPTGGLGEFVLEYDLAHLRKGEPDRPIQQPIAPAYGSMTGDD